MVRGVPRCDLDCQVERAWPRHSSRSYRRRKPRILGDKFTSRHFGHGHLKAVSFGKTMWPHFSQICRPLGRTLMGLNSVPKTQ
jgi:hypothetical protein